MLSVVIATKDRSEALSDISLPSLLRQRDANFEVIVWDASGDSLSADVCSRASADFASAGIPLRYFKAPRAGLPAQRNDAVAKAKGDVVFFIDDDSEVGSGGMRILSDFFAGFAWVKGAALMLLDKQPIRRAQAPSVLSVARRAASWGMSSIFCCKKTAYRSIKGSTVNNMPLADLPGKAEWLSGCCMAFRRDIFEELKFEERLQAFGGYGLGEDVDFSHRVYLRYGEPLLVVSGAFVTHHNALGGRITDRRRHAAAVFFNSAVIRGNFLGYKHCGLLSFLREYRIGKALSMLANGFSVREIAGGYGAAKKRLNEEKHDPEGEPHKG